MRRHGARGAQGGAHRRRSRHVDTALKGGSGPGELGASRPHEAEEEGRHLSHLDLLAPLGDAIPAVVAVDVLEGACGGSSRCRRAPASRGRPPRSRKPVSGLGVLGGVGHRRRITRRASGVTGLLPICCQPNPSATEIKGRQRSSSVTRTDGGSQRATSGKLVDAECAQGDSNTRPSDDLSDAPAKAALCLHFLASVREVSASLPVSRGAVLHPRA